MNINTKLIYSTLEVPIFERILPGKKEKAPSFFLGLLIMMITNLLNPSLVYLSY